MKKFLTLLTIIMLFFTITVQAETFVVTCDSLNVRSLPGTANPIIGQVYKNQKLDVSVYDGSWARINYNGINGYVSCKYISFYTPVKYSNDDLYLLARVVQTESGASWATDEHQRAVASVVINRVNDSRFPNTISGVILQKGQYSGYRIYNYTPSQRAISNAKYVLENGSQIPSNVVWQAQCRQGKGVWKYIQGHYFCY